MKVVWGCFFFVCLFLVFFWGGNNRINQRFRWILKLIFCTLLICYLRLVMLTVMIIIIAFFLRHLTKAKWRGAGGSQISNIHKYRTMFLSASTHNHICSTRSLSLSHAHTHTHTGKHIVSHIHTHTHTLCDSLSLSSHSLSQDQNHVT